MIILAIASISVIAGVLLQSGNSSGLSGSITGGAEQLLGKKKAKGYDAILAKITVVASVVFIVSSLVLVMME